MTRRQSRPDQMEESIVFPPASLEGPGVQPTAGPGYPATMDDNTLPDLREPRHQFVEAFGGRTHEERRPMNVVEMRRSIASDFRRRAYTWSDVKWAYVAGGVLGFVLATVVNLLVLVAVSR